MTKKTHPLEGVTAEQMMQSGLDRMKESRDQGAGFVKKHRNNPKVTPRELRRKDR